MRQKKLAQRAASAALAACMMFTLSAPALAESTNALMQMSINSRSSIARLNEENSIPEDAVTLDIADGNIEVSVNAEGVQTAKQGDQTYTGVFVVTGTSTTNKLVIKGDSGTAAKVYLKDLNIDTSSKIRVSPVSVDGNVELIVEGNNLLRSGQYAAALEKVGSGSLIIDGSGQLETHGAYQGAGIGGGQNADVHNIEIRGGTIIAYGGEGAAGIGGSNHGSVDGITIIGGTVKAFGNTCAAAIGGQSGNVSNITITGGNITLQKRGDASWIGTHTTEFSIDADTIKGSITYLNEDGSTNHVVEKLYDIKVENGTTDKAKAKVDEVVTVEAVKPADPGVRGQRI